MQYNRNDVKLSPKDPIAYFTHGKARLFTKQLKLALGVCNAAVEIDPASGRSTHLQGLVRDLIEDTEGAEEDYGRPRELGYDDWDIECKG